MRRLGEFGIACIVLVACGCGPKTAAVGSPAPEFQIESLSMPGKLAHLTDYKGKVVVLDFWATWCGPCRLVANTLDKFNKTYGPQGVVFIGITNEERATVEKFEKTAKHGYPIFLDPNNSAGHAYPGEYIPRVYVIDRAGKLVYMEDSSTPSDPSKDAENAIQDCLKT